MNKQRGSGCMIGSLGRGLLGIGFCGVLAACSGGAGSGANAGAAGTSAGGGASDGCVSKPDAVFTAQRFGETDLIRQIQIDDSTLYFRTLDSLMKVPTAGGNPELVADLSQQEPSEFWVQSGALLVRSDAALFTVPKAGGQPTKLGASLSPAPSNFADTQLSSSDFYWVADASSEYGIYHRELSGSTVDTVYSTKHEIRGLQLVGERLYFQDRTTGDIESVPVAGGEPTKLADADASDELVASDATNLYVIGQLGVASGTNYGFYRQPVTGDAATLLEKGLFIADALDIAPTASGAYLAAPANVSPNHTDPTDVSPALLFAATNDSSAELRWCIDSSYTLHALAVQDHTAYVSVYSSNANQATIARVSLP